jgi:hypothetical protein
LNPNLSKCETTTKTKVLHGGILPAMHVVVVVVVVAVSTFLPSHAAAQV